ncbi:MAG TPA: type I-E CRISPR-associated protein Cas7/Cse4/CasC [Syntrophorhabdaceae bacterium]|nr:type I-E CRISPR-associated protein Cas7/Cse4/CasC [Syntrophorhabdaceae bacterium]
MKKVFVDFHIIQTLPPSCVNRDDTGSPKTAIYGGVRRARVSSQAWKRAMRLMFKEYLDESELGSRTKKIVDMVAGEILAKDSTKSQDDAKSLAEKIINTANVTTKDAEAKALFFMSRKQAENLAELVLRNPKATKKEAQAVLNMGHGVDVALFGRMVAEDPSLNTDASAQVAHCISTHKVSNEYDYFTAVDDRSSDDNSGAGMLGTIEYNSATLYRYATVAAHELFSQLADDGAALEKAINEFARAFITSMPTGKQNTFANRTMPDAVIVAVRHDSPVNLSGAFEEPIKGEGYSRQSILRLIEYSDQIYEDFCGKPTKTYVIGNVPCDPGARVGLPVMLANLGKDICNMLGVRS